MYHENPAWSLEIVLTHGSAYIWAVSLVDEPKELNKAKWKTFFSSGSVSMALSHLYKCLITSFKVFLFCSTAAISQMTLFEKKERMWIFLSQQVCFLRWIQLPRTTFSLCTTGFYAFKKIIERSSIYKVLELCPRDLFSHTKKRLVGVNKNIAFSK